ncbi:hypothetical protein AVEN_103254-1 [Araneus ventricosus]|uniref:ATP-dependent DNA helicase n=1 Tax=Araneus ventricosus TaxID=182803 RepID=A0A4Y2R6B8_ARAVE|nr:hypothetical protein AVEN_103254-1 [Araneus ventricosus]
MHPEEQKKIFLINVLLAKIRIEKYFARCSNFRYCCNVDHWWTSSNMDPQKLCNGSILIVKALHAHITETTILTAPFEGEHVLIPRISLIPIGLSFSFQRLQFSLRLTFAITINKVQGQSLRVTGLDLTD